MVWHKDRRQWARIESSEINPYIYGQMIFDKGAKTIQWGKRQSFQKIVLRKLNINIQNN